MDKPDSEYHADTIAAVKIATEILKYLWASDTTANIAQAALGNGWSRLCLGMKINPEQFKEMCNEVQKLYRKSYNDKYGKQQKL